MNFRILALVTILVAAASTPSAFAWRFFGGFGGNNAGYNAFGGHAADSFYRNGGASPYASYYNNGAPSYYAQNANSPIGAYSPTNGVFPNSGGYSTWQRNGVGFYGASPEAWRYVAAGSRDSGVGFSPYDFYG